MTFDGEWSGVFIDAMTAGEIASLLDYAWEYLEIDPDIPMEETRIGGLKKLLRSGYDES